MPKFVNPLIDIVFKTLWLRADDDLRAYLNRIVGYAVNKDISNYHIGANETGIVRMGNIENKVDILLESDDGKIDIELNSIKDTNGFTPIRIALNKSLVYLSYYITTYYDHDKKNMYRVPINVEQINFNAFHCPDNYLVERLDFKLCDTSNNISEQGIEYHHIYLPRMMELCYTKDEEIYKDYAMLMSKSYEEMESIAGKDKGRLALIKLLKNLGSDDRFMTVVDKLEYEKILHTEEGLQQGIEQGIEQGSEQAKKAMIKSLAGNNVPIEIIAESAEKSIEEVEEILKNDA